MSKKIGKIILVFGALVMAVIAVIGAANVACACYVAHRLHSFND